MTTGESTEYFHYFCLLFSSGGVQRGKDEEGLNGFLEEDILKIVKSGETLKCDICNKTGATIPCHKKTCRKKYHFACGSLCTDPGEHVFIFRNNMNSFCYNHAPKQGKITNSELKRGKLGYSFTLQGFFVLSRRVREAV